MTKIITHLCEMLTFKINQHIHLKANFNGIHFNLCFENNFITLLFADWSKNKVAQKSLLTPETKPQGKIRPENIFKIVNNIVNSYSGHSE